jgi:hypothetical protein
MIEHLTSDNFTPSTLRIVGCNRIGKKNTGPQSRPVMPRRLSPEHDHDDQRLKPHPLKQDIQNHRLRQMGKQKETRP